MTSTPDTELLEHLKKQCAFFESRAVSFAEEARYLRISGSPWHVLLLHKAWHAINDEIDDYTALGNVSDAIEEALEKTGRRCVRCNTASLGDEVSFVDAHYCTACDVRDEALTWATFVGCEIDLSGLEE